MTTIRAAILFFDAYEGMEPAGDGVIEGLGAQCGAIYRIVDSASFDAARRAKIMTDCDAVLLCDNRYLYPETYVAGMAARLAECGYECAGLDGEVFPDLYDGLEDTICRLGAAEGGLEVNALGIGGTIMKAPCLAAFGDMPDAFFGNGWRYASWVLANRLEQQGRRRWLLKGDDPRKPVANAAPAPRRVSPVEIVRSIHAFAGMRRLALPPVTA